jgi:UDP-N-acetylglucosamine acyltransferase
MVGGLYRITKDIPHFTLAGEEPLRILGLNTIGLRRAQFSSEVRNDIQAFYREFYSSKLLNSQFWERAASRTDLSPEIRRIVEFYRNTKRGVTAWAASFHAA